jgi:hypothetical protein
MELEQSYKFECEEPEEDDEVERPRREAFSQLFEDARATHLPHDPHRADDPEDPEDAQARRAAEEIEDASVPHVRALRRRSSAEE